MQIPRAFFFVFSNPIRFQLTLGSLTLASTAEITFPYVRYAHAGEGGPVSV